MSDGDRRYIKKLKKVSEHSNKLLGAQYNDKMRKYHSISGDRWRA